MTTGPSFWSTFPIASCTSVLYAFCASSASRCSCFCWSASRSQSLEHRAWPSWAHISSGRLQRPSDPRWSLPLPVQSRSGRSLRGRPGAEVERRALSQVLLQELLAPGGWPSGRCLRWRVLPQQGRRRVRAWNSCGVWCSFRILWDRVYRRVRRTAHPHVVHPAPRRATLLAANPYRSLSFQTNHIAVWGLLQRLDYIARLMQGSNLISRNMERSARSLRFFVNLRAKAWTKSHIWRGEWQSGFGIRIAS